MNESLDLSIVIPAFNARITIGQTLESVRPLVEIGAECIVVDDGSTDLTAEVVDALILEGFPITLVRQVNRGLSGARNTGIEHSTRHWITFVDADDLVEPQGIVEALHGAKHTGLRIAKSRIASSTLGEVSRHPAVTVLDGRPSRQAYTIRSLDHWLLWAWGGLLGAVFNRGLLADMKPPFEDVPFGEDLVFTYTLTTLERDYVDVPLVGYRYITGRSTQMTDASSSLRLEIEEAFRACEMVAIGQPPERRALFWILVARYRWSRSRQVDPALLPSYQQGILDFSDGLRIRLGLSRLQLCSYLARVPVRLLR